MTNHPGRCAATPPLKGGEWTRLETKPIPLLSKGWPRSGRARSILSCSPEGRSFCGALQASKKRIGLERLDEVAGRAHGKNTMSNSLWFKAAICECCYL